MLIEFNKQVKILILAQPSQEQDPPMVAHVEPGQSHSDSHREVVGYSRDLWVKQYVLERHWCICSKHM